MQLTLAEIARILGCPNPPVAGMARGYSIDSRTIRPGEVFFALRGERHDGHDHVLTALGGGALAAVVEESVYPRFAEHFSARLLPVPDTLLALQTLASAIRRRWGRKVIGITGSAGKTTTKEMVARVLETRYRVLKNEGNLNNHIGVPLSLLRLTPAHDLAVLEMGMNHAGEIARLAEIAAPQAGVFTIVGPVHLEHFGSIEGIAAAKRELAEALPAGGAVVLNADDPFVAHFGGGFTGQQVWYGTKLDAARPGDATVRIVEAQCGEAGSEVVLQVRRGSALRPGEDLLDRQVRFHLPLLGRHNVSNAAAAVAAGLVFGVDVETAARALEGMRPAAQRGEVERLGGLTIINDSYNSNPPAVEQMLGVLRQAQGRRIAVLGEMLELGPAAAELHRRVGRLLGQEGGIQALFTVRGQARAIADGAREAGFTGFIAHYESPQACGAALRDFLQPGDVVLLKASRGVRLEGVMEFIRQSPAASV